MNIGTFSVLFEIPPATSSVAPNSPKLLIQLKIKPDKMPPKESLNVVSMKERKGFAPRVKAICS